MRVSLQSFPQGGEIQFQLSLLNITSLGAAERQAQELEKLLEEQCTNEKR
jgi:hypothetical protein